MERKRVTLANLQLLLLFLLAGRCRAQDESGADTTVIIAIFLPFAIFFVVTAGICILFWWCYCHISMLAKQPHYHRPRYVYNYPRPQQNVSPQNRATSNGQSHSTETVTLSSINLNSTQTGDDSTTSQSTALNPSSPASAQAYSGQAYTSPPTVTASNAPPAAPAGATSESQTVPQASEPVSLSEATLHQGDAPPAYAEAVKMKTVIVMDET